MHGWIGQILKVMYYSFSLASNHVDYHECECDSCK